MFGVLTRPDLHISDFSRKGMRSAEFLGSFDTEILEQSEILMKYEGYIERELKAIGRSHHLENKKIPSTLDYAAIQSMSRESREKLIHIRPATIGQASRISGIRPSDIAILSVVVERHSRSATN